MILRILLLFPCRLAFVAQPDLLPNIRLNPAILLQYGCLMVSMDRGLLPETIISTFLYVDSRFSFLRTAVVVVVAGNIVVVVVIASL